MHGARREKEETKEGEASLLESGIRLGEVERWHRQKRWEY